MVRLTVRVQPGARKDEVLGFVGDVLRVRVTAPPVDGKANVALAGLLARTFGVRPSQISLLRGHRSREKVLEVEGLSLEEAQRLLSPEEGAP